MAEAESTVNPSLDPLSQMLGEINAKLDMVQKTQSEDRTASAAWRTDMRREMATVKEVASEVKGRANNTADQLAEVRAEIKDDIAVVHKRIDAISIETGDTRDWKLRAEGAGKLTKIVWAVLSAVGLGGLVAFLESLRRGGPHP